MNEVVDTQAKTVVKKVGLYAKIPFLCGLPLYLIVTHVGHLHTYLGVGKQSLKMVGSSVYAGTYMIRRSSPLNIFQLDPYGKICVDHAGATITDTSYSYQDEVYSYNGDYTISGDSENSVITVLSGNHQLTLQNTTFAALNIQNTSDVTIQLEDHAKIGVVNVDENARLKLAGIGNILADPTMLKIGECNGTIYNEEGNRMIQTEILFENPGSYQLKLNGEILTVETDAEGRAQLLLAEGAYDLRIDAGPFFFQENLIQFNRYRLTNEVFIFFRLCNNVVMIVL